MSLQVGQRTGAGVGGGGIILYKQVNSLNEITQADKQTLQDFYEKGIIAIVYNLGDSQYYQWALVNNIYDWILNFITEGLIVKEEDLLTFQDNNSLCAFIWGRIFSKEETFLLRNNTVKVSITTEDINSDFNVRLANG